MNRKNTMVISNTNQLPEALNAFKARVLKMIMSEAITHIKCCIHGALGWLNIKELSVLRDIIVTIWEKHEIT